MSPAIARKPVIRDGEVVVIVPARNEHGQIVSTLLALLNQTRPPAEIIVVANNCTDDTADLARACGVTVLEMPTNSKMKAGALNFGLKYLLGDINSSGYIVPEYIMTMDADTVVEEHFVEYTINVLNNDPRLGGISAVCRGKSGLGSNRYQRALAWFQQAEYARAGSSRLLVDIHTLSGAGSMLRTKAVLEVIEHRGLLYVERPCLVEDYESTLAMKERGWKVTNNFHCVAYTDLMLSVRALLKQRIRWVRGTIDELRLRGFHSHTRVSYLTLWSSPIFMLLFYIGWPLTIANTVVSHSVTVVTLIFLGMLGFYQSFSARDLTWKGKIACFILLPELLFTILRHYWIIRSVAQSYSSTQHEWSE